MRISRIYSLPFFAIILLFFITYFYEPLSLNILGKSLYNESRSLIRPCVIGTGENGRANNEYAARSSFAYSPYRLLINPEHLCRKGLNDSHTPSLMILVSSALQNSRRREAIRNTWGSVASTSSGRRYVQLAFLVGSTVNETLQKEVEREADRHSDIIQQDFVDSYRNLTLKSIMMLRWVTEYCPNVDYVLKTDDDMYVNVDNLIITLLHAPENNNIIYGVLMHLYKPHRERKSKWFVPEGQFDGDVYPDFVSGTAYVMSGDTVPKLLNASDSVPFLFLEDVFITGLCAERSHVRRLNLKGFSKSKRPPTGRAFQGAITGHFVNVEDMYKIWRELREDKKLN